MKKRFMFTFFGLGLLLVSQFQLGSAQQLTDLAEVASGVGSITLDNGDKVDIKAVAVFLRENGHAEVWLMTPRENVYAGGRWFQEARPSAIRLEITDDTKGMPSSGWGMVTLREGVVPVTTLTMRVSRLDGTSFFADFLANDYRPCQK